MLGEVIVSLTVVRVLVLFMHGGGVDVDRLWLPVVTRLLRRIALVPLSVETPFRVIPIRNEDDRVFARLPGQH